MIKRLKNLDIGIPCILASIYFFALPLTITINAAGNSFLKLLTIPIAICLVVSLFLYKDKLELNIIHLISIPFLISVVITLFADHNIESLQYVRGYIETIVLLFLISLRKYTTDEIKAFEFTQLLLLAVMIMLGFTGAGWGGDRNSMTLFGATSDPNYFVGFFLLPMAVALKKMKESKTYMLVCMPMVILGAYIALTSGSRGGLFALTVMIISFVLIDTKETKKKLVNIAVAAVAAIILWVVVMPILPEEVFSRLSIKELIESRGTGRGDIWLSMLDEIKNSTWELFCGRGIMAYHEMMMNGKLVTVVAHNQFIQSLYNQGIFGFAAFMLLSLAAVLRNVKKRGYISAAMLGMLALSMTLSISPSIKAFWNLLIYAALSFESTKK